MSRTMLSTSQASSDPSSRDAHGLAYSEEFLNSLRTVPSSHHSSNSTPTSSSSSSSNQPNITLDDDQDASSTPVPKYRGLVWVVCEDDLTHEQRKKLFKRRTPNGTDPVPDPTRDMKKAKEKKPKSKKSKDQVAEKVVVKLEDEDGELGDVIMSDDFDPEALGFDEDSWDEDDESDDWEDDDESSFADDESLYSSGYSDEDREVDVAISSGSLEMGGDAGSVGSNASSPSSDSEGAGSMQVATPSVGSPLSGSNIGVRCVEDVEMDVDLDVNGGAVGVVTVDEGSHVKEKARHVDKDEGKHMHPVAQRVRVVAPAPPSSPTTVANGGSLSVEIPPVTSSIPISKAKSEETGPAKSTHIRQHVVQSHHHSHPPAHKRARPRTPPLLTSSFRPGELLARVREEASRPSSPLPEQAKDGARVSRSKWKWEFVKPKVPDGISLRNFGIQVPIYATISDIVVYSPKGASPNAIKLAQRFSEAIDRKRIWRIRRKLGFEEGEVVEGGPLQARGSAAGAKTLEQVSEELAQYNVFVLDSEAEEIRKELPHLVVKMCEPGGVLSGEKGKELLAGSSNVHGRSKDMGAHTVATDGRLDAMEVFDFEVGSVPHSHVVQPPTLATSEDLAPNTVDFACREKEEMRDLTRASEILSVWPLDASAAVSTTTTMHTSAISSLRDIGRSSSVPPPRTTQVGAGGPLPWTTELGQVFLGNADDVPLPDDPSAPMMHFHNGRPRTDGDWDSVMDGLDVEEPRRGGGMDVDHPVEGEGDWARDMRSPRDSEWVDVNEPEQLSEDDPFNYIPSNDPDKGMGYDICFECHDRAPYPSVAHLTAAEEHLGRLEAMWVRRCVAKALKERSGRGGQVKIPPRPPPNANAVIHLPFPSMHLHTRMSSLVIVLDFLAKWLKPPNMEVTFSTAPSPRHGAQAADEEDGEEKDKSRNGGRRWSTVSSLFPGFPSTSSSFFGADVSGPGVHPPTPRNRSFTSPPGSRMPGVVDNASHPSTPMLSTSYPSNSPISSGSFASGTLHPASISFSSPPTSPVTRPLKILIYSNDGYTESSVAALSLLMRMRVLKLPEAYLELQVAKRRSFYVYGDDLGGLRKIEARIAEEREVKRRREEEARAKEREKERERRQSLTAGMDSAQPTVHGRVAVPESASNGESRRMMSAVAAAGRRPAAKSVSFAQAPIIHPPSSTVSTPLPPVLSSVSATVPVSASLSDDSTNTRISPSPLHGHPTPSSNAITPIMIHTDADFANAPVTSIVAGPSSAPVPSPSVGLPPHLHGHARSDAANGHHPDRQLVKGRPRANTSPWLPSLFGDHQSWFNDNRFDGSFPSRVLPFLYLGNLNHASNAYMLHALGITHVVSVGECALVPPPHLNNYNNNGSSPSCPPHSSAGHFVPGKGPGGQGSLWIEEREGRIKVLDIKGICDDGIDTLEPQLEPICEWIDRARAEGGQVLVHCRVGVSRSATVVIAYVMKHLRLPLVDAYLIVRSRRLSVVIQPNMRLLYNLCGWEIKLAKERAGNDEARLRMELSRAVSWPWLAREVHKLNEKYINC
ncbi:hypothetical protein ONZ45_g5943 [Pleurotus djamor]|nr:hypothetical protein ONZ45_g5943 [Pleurotus djamor]